MIKVTCGYPKGVSRTKTTELSSKDPINDPSDNPTHVPPTDIYRAPIDAPSAGQHISQAKCQSGIPDPGQSQTHILSCEGVKCQLQG